MYKNKEAYLVMQYQCSSCGHLENVWNSRDGVVPFSVPCSSRRKHGCVGAMSHANWHLDRRMKNFKLMDGFKYFVSITPVRANEMAFEVCTRLQQDGRLSSDAFDEKLAKVAASFLGDGNQPELVTFKVPSAATSVLDTSEIEVAPSRGHLPPNKQSEVFHHTV